MVSRFMVCEVLRSYVRLYALGFMGFVMSCYAKQWYVEFEMWGRMRGIHFYILHYFR